MRRNYIIITNLLELSVLVTSGHTVLLKNPWITVSTLTVHCLYINIIYSCADLSSVSEHCGVTLAGPPPRLPLADKLPLRLRHDNVGSPMGSLLGAFNLRESFELNFWSGLELVCEFRCSLINGFPSVAPNPSVLPRALSHLQAMLRSSSHLRVHWNSPHRLFPSLWEWANGALNLLAEEWFQGLSWILFRTGVLSNFE